MLSLGLSQRDDFDDPLPKEIEDEFYKVDDLLEESLPVLSVPPW